MRSSSLYLTKYRLAPSLADCSRLYSANVSSTSRTSGLGIITNLARRIVSAKWRK